MNVTTHTVKVRQPETVGDLVKVIRDNNVPDRATMRQSAIRGDRPGESDAYFIEFTWTTS